MPAKSGEPTNEIKADSTSTQTTPSFSVATRMPMESGCTMKSMARVNHWFLFMVGVPTIQTSFGKIIPELSKTRKIIAVELQAHGRTGDRNTPISFEQDADDVAALFKNLKIQKADVHGIQQWRNTTMQLAIRHASLVDKIIVASAFYKRSGMQPGFLGFYEERYDERYAANLER